MVNNYDVVMFVGASKVISASRNYSSLDNFAYRAWDSGAIIAAYGQGVEVLARARILDGGVEVTGDIRSRRVVRGYGGEFINEPLVVDGRFVTAQPQVTNLETGPVGAMGLANEILGMLKQQQESENDRE
jgi:putative intracellular protease/amidase